MSKSDKSTGPSPITAEAAAADAGLKTEAPTVAVVPGPTVYFDAFRGRLGPDFWRGTTLDLTGSPTTAPVTFAPNFGATYSYRSNPSLVFVPAATAAPPTYVFESAPSTKADRPEKGSESGVSTLTKDELADAGFRAKMSERGANGVAGNAKLKNWFVEGGPANMFVVSIDIRGSTDLMLKSTTPEDFVAFVSPLCERLGTVVLSNHGIIDKFTGDGLLAYFPEEYSGPDAGEHAIAAAVASHAAFAATYAESQSRFKSVRADAGLGVGIDYGSCSLLKILNTPTIIGEPVVYACRLGGAPAGSTYLNQQAFQALLARGRKAGSFEPRTLGLKNEAPIVVHALRDSDPGRPLASPPWLAKTDDDDAQPGRPVAATVAKAPKKRT